MYRITSFTGTLQRLERLDRAPKQLLVEGQPLEQLLTKPIVAVVGTRKPTPYGKQITEQFVASLSQQGIVIISGLAFGIDSIAHRTSIEQGGITIAVLPSNLATIYPASHRQLAKQIAERGSLITEYEADGVPMKHQFIDRNRLIAALADVVLIPEAAEKSGSLHTARFAQKMAVPVCAVPGSITSLMSSGTNQLIKQGCHAVTSAQDILALLNLDEKKSIQTELFGSNDTETAILRSIADGHHESVELQSLLKLDTISFQRAMSMLEINGRVKSGELGTWHLL